MHIVYAYITTKNITHKTNNDFGLINQSSPVVGLFSFYSTIVTSDKFEVQNIVVSHNHSFNLLKMYLIKKKMYQIYSKI